MKPQISNLISSPTQFWLDHQPVRYVNKENPFDPNQLQRFDMGEWTSSCSPKVKEVIKNVQPTDLQEYPDPNASALKDAIATRHAVTSNMITPCCGSDELIDTLPRILLKEGNAAVIVTPTFFRFGEATTRVGGQLIKISTGFETNFSLNESTVEKIIKAGNQPEVDVVWLCNPNNPTGQIIRPDLLQTIVENTQAFVIVDEVFSGLVDPVEADSNLELARKQENILFLRSLSKVDGLSGIRIGWGIGHPHTIALLEKWRLPFNTSTLAQKIAIAAIEDTDHTDIVRNQITTERQFIEQQIDQMPGLELIHESKANIFLLRHQRKDLFQELLEKGILVADFRQADGVEGMGFVRITIQNRERNQSLLTTLKEICL